MRIATITILILSSMMCTYGQEYKAEVCIKGFSMTQDQDETSSETSLRRSFDGGGVAIQMSYNLNLYLNAGLFYSKLIPGENAELRNSVGYANSVLSDFQSYGITFQAGTNRDRRIRVYGTFNAFYAQLKDTYDKQYFGSEQDLTFSKAGSGFSLGLGVVLKLSRRFSFNVFEAKATYYSAGLNYVDNQSFIGSNIESGILYKFLKVR